MKKINVDNPRLIAAQMSRSADQLAALLTRYQT